MLLFVAGTLYSEDTARKRASGGKDLFSSNLEVKTCFAYEKACTLFCLYFDGLVHDLFT